MKTLVALFIVLCTAYVHGQVPEPWQYLMKDKDLSVFKQYADRYSSRTEGGEWDTVYYRSLCDNFNEGLMSYENWVDNTPASAYRSTTYYIRLLTQGHRIIYAQLMEELNEEGNLPDTARFAERDVYKNDTAYALLQHTFKAAFETEMNAADLFRIDIEYGYLCGFGAGAPDARQQVDTMLAHSDRASLLSWLRATNTEKQLYAYDACMQLKHRGLKLTATELKLMRVIAAKKGTVNACGGCFYGTGDIEDIIRQIKHRKQDEHVTGFFRFKDIE